MGIRDIERRIREQAAMERKESELLIDQLRRMLNGVRELKEQLKELEKQYGKDIKKDKKSYEELVAVRRELGLPEEMGIWQWQDRAGRFNKSKFYEQLGIEILELIRKRVKETGGIVTFAELLVLLQKERPGGSPPINDVKESLQHLVKQKLIPPLKELENGVILVEVIPVEFSPDHEKVLSLAALTASITVEDLVRKAGWSLERATRVLEELERKGIAIVDEEYAEGKRYYFPGLG